MTLKPEARRQMQALLDSIREQHKAYMITSRRFADLLGWDSVDGPTRQTLLRYSQILRDEDRGIWSIQQYLKGQLDGGTE